MRRQLASAFKNTKLSIPRPERGQSTTEYALIILLVAIALVGAVGGFGTGLGGYYNTIIAGFP